MGIVKYCVSYAEATHAAERLFPHSVKPRTDSWADGVQWCLSTLDSDDGFQINASTKCYVVDGRVAWCMHGGEFRFKDPNAALEFRMRWS